MAHFAEIDERHIVVRVLVVPDEQEHRGQEYLAEDLGLGGTWIQTSYNRNFRVNYAGPGYTYDPNYDMFISPRPYPSWTTLNTELGCWDPPTPYPTDGNKYDWDEENQEWVLVS